MKKLELRPLIGVSDITFGMNRDEVRSAFAWDSVVHPTWSTVECYPAVSLKVHFDGSGRAEFIEVSRDKQIDIFWEDLNIFGTSAEDIVNNVSQRFAVDRSDEEFGYSLMFPEIELAFWRSTIPDNDSDEDGKYFSTVGIGRKGYYTDRR